MGPGLRQLLRLAAPSPVKAAERALNPRARLALSSNPDGSLAALLEDCPTPPCGCWRPKPVWTSADFGALRDTVAAKWFRRRSTSSAASNAC